MVPDSQKPKISFEFFYILGYSPRRTAPSGTSPGLRNQIHFKVLLQDNFEINGGQQAPAINGQFLDMIEVPFWDQNPKHNPPQVELLLDFRGPDIGDFVYHCHILGHEDLGMMAIIRVVPNTSKLATPKDKDAPATAEKVPTQPAANQPAIIVRGGGNLE